MNENLHRVIGIDLGTTYSAVATYNKSIEQTEIIVNRKEGDTPTTPSVISLDPMLRKAIVGYVAKRNLAFDPQNTVIEIKREMGEVFLPETLDKFQARDIFKPKGDGYEGDPVKVKFDGEWRLPQEISAFTLMKMKEVAETEMGGEIRDAVITVPAYFTEKQRKATEEAALLAGLYPRQLIPEPTAAAICYGVDRFEAERKVYLVYDLGGGTFDVSIITVEEEKIEVIATSGDPRLGGGDFDDAIMEWAVGELRQNHRLDVGAKPAAKAIIKLNAEMAKIDLSTYTDAKMSLLELRPENPPILDLSRDKFEKLIDPLLNKSLSYVDTAIKLAQEKKGLSREDIDAILLVGGSSKIPKVRTKLLDYFQKDEDFLRANLDPDAVVARGAAMLALRFAPSPAPFDITRRVDSSQINTLAEQDLQIRHITEHSLGVGVQNNMVSKIVDQGTNIPISETRGGYTNPGPYEYIDVLVYQGEGEYAFDNTLIGMLKIGPMELKPEGHHQFEVTFTLDENGLLSMAVHHINEGKRYEAKFEHKTGIGGREALAVVRNKLLPMYASTSALPLPGATHTSASQVPPPSSAPSSQAVPPPAASSAAPAPPDASAEAAPPSTPEQPAPQASAAQSGAGNGAILEPSSEVPDQFKGLVRRAHKQLLNRPDPKLLRIYNEFVTALNQGQTDEDLEDLGEDLKDVYQQCRF